jgi:hypothetical protein
MYPAKSFDTALWCFAEDPGNEYIRLPPLPCKKEACPRYRTEFPHCVMMSRNYSHAREQPADLLHPDLKVGFCSLSG